MSGVANWHSRSLPLFGRLGRSAAHGRTTHPERSMPSDDGLDDVLVQLVVTIVVIAIAIGLYVGMRNTIRHDCHAKGGQFVSGPYPGCVEPTNPTK